MPVTVHHHRPIDCGGLVAHSTLHETGDSVDVVESETLVVRDARGLAIAGYRAGHWTDFRITPAEPADEPVEAAATTGEVLTAGTLQAVLTFDKDGIRVTPVNSESRDSGAPDNVVLFPTGAPGWVADSPTLSAVAAHIREGFEHSRLLQL